MNIWRAMFLIPIVLPMGACLTGDPSSTLVPQTPVPTVTAIPITQQRTATEAPPLLLSTTEPTIADTAAPTSAPSRTPVPLLPFRQPTFAELEAFLGTYFTVVDSTDGDIIIIGELQYRDVTGDGLDDLIALKPAELFILAWAGEGYKLVFHTHETELRGWFGTPTRMELDDMTGDGIPEVILDHTYLTGGTGWFVYVTERSVIHCLSDPCAVVWKDLTAIRDDLFPPGNMERYEVSTSAVIAEDGTPMIRAYSAGFSLNHFGDLDWEPYFPDHYADGLSIFETAVTWYSWTGSAFIETGREIASLQQVIHSDLNTYAISSSGNTAEIIILDQVGMDFWRENCSLRFNGVAYEHAFPCSDRFTRVDWIDVVGDAREEVVVKAFSGLTFEQAQEIKYDYCQYQRLLIFSEAGTGFRLIAEVVGCIVESDLYGVRLEDVDGDGIPEIRSAGLLPGGFELLYKFDGEQFVLWNGG